jgi:hypothetical protein
MKACIILHNMIVEDERDSYLQYYDSNPSAVVTPVEVVREGQISFLSFIENYHSMKDISTHVQLRKDLIKHQWEIKGHDSEDAKI